jgi:Tol biopolymer transport system component
MRALRLALHSCPVLAALLVSFLTQAPGASGQEQATNLFQQALRMERVSGDLEGAIRLYQQVVETGDRPLGARALIRIAESYEKLGRKGAQDAYARVIAEFGDQAEQVAVARERLAQLAEPAPATDGLVARRLLEDDGCKISYLKPSPDGKLLAYNDVCNSLTVHVLDLASGEDRQLTSEGMHFGAAWSPDGRRIATAEMAPRQQLKLIDLGTGEVEEVAHMGGVFFLPDDWSSDGDHLAGMVREGGSGLASTVVVSLSSEHRIPLGSASATAQMIPRAVFSPDGRLVAFSDASDGNRDIYVLNLESGARERVSTAPEEDWGAVWSPDGRALVYQNTDGTWAQEIVDGRAKGAPRLLSSTVYGMPQGTNSWTANGFYYASQNTATNAHRIPVDPATARPLGPPQPLTEAMPGLDWNTQFAWSPDMERVAFGGWSDPHHISVARGRSVTSMHLGDDTYLGEIWWSGDGSEVLYSARIGEEEGYRLIVRALDPGSGSTRELVPPRESISHVHLSPDGGRMVFLRPSDPRPENALTAVDELVAADVGGPTTERVLATSSGTDGYLSTQITQPAFSPDGSQVMFIRLHKVGEGYGAQDLERSLWVVPADGSGPARQLHRSKGIPIAFWSPDSRWIVFPDSDDSGGGGGSGFLGVISAETGEVHPLLTEADMKALGMLGAIPRAWSPDGRWIGIIEVKGSFDFWVMPDPLAGKPSS